MTTYTKGILQPDDAKRHFSINRYTPVISLQDVIQHYWIVRWNLPLDYRYESKTLAYPAVNIIVSGEGAHVGGPSLSTFSYDLIGSGVVYGVLFTPAGFSAMFDGSIKTLTNKKVAIDTIAQLKDMDLSRIYHRTNQDAVDYLDNAFENVSPQLSEKAIRINQIFDEIRLDRSLVRVADLCRRFDVSERILQQRFSQYVGVTPKWTIMRYRMQDAADLLYADPARSLTDIAFELRYVDQAHFSRDFKRVIGVSPLAYRRSQQKHPVQ